MKNMRALLKKHNVFSGLVLVIIITALSYPVFYQRMMNATDNDYIQHIQFTQLLLERSFSDIPGFVLAHPIIQILLGGLYWLSRSHIDLYQGMILLMVLSNVLTALIIYAWLDGIQGKWKEIQRVFWAVTVPFITPVFALAPVDGRYYFGYIGLANYHNPTVEFLKPFALLVFILAVRVFTHKQNPKWMIWASAALMIFSSLIKQNYTICLIPAMGLLALIALICKKEMDWRLGIFGFVLPAVLTLALQSFLTFFLPGTEQDGIIFAPLVVERYFSDFLLWKFLLSIVFPLAILILTARQSLKDTEMQLAWASFMAGVGQVYLFAEGGNRLLHGNFRWSAQISLFVLVVVSVRFLFSRLASLRQLNWKHYFFGLVSYLPHLTCGVLYYLYCYFSIHYS
jgi:hypothetical protein